jgi:hypothetical protein
LSASSPCAVSHRERSSTISNHDLIPSIPSHARSNLTDVSLSLTSSMDEEECEHCLELERDPHGFTTTSESLPAQTAPLSPTSGEFQSGQCSPCSSTPSSEPLRRIGQRGKAEIVAIEHKLPGQYVYGCGDNLFINARRKDGSITCIRYVSTFLVPFPYAQYYLFGWISVANFNLLPFSFVYACSRAV